MPIAPAIPRDEGKPAGGETIHLFAMGLRGTCDTVLDHGGIIDGATLKASRVVGRKRY